MNFDPEATSVLVVDDERDIRDGAERILTRMQCRVCKATRGDEALVLFDQEPIAIVLLDMKMPGMDGMEVLRQIRQRDEQVLVIVITGYATVEMAIEAMKQGAYDFIPKPFEPDQLRIVVNRALDKLRLTRETERLEQARRRTLADLGKEKSRVRTIIESLPNGVVVTNNQGEVVLINPAFRQMLAIDPNRTADTNIDVLFDDPELCDLIRDISRGRYIDYDDIPTRELVLPEDRFMLVRGQPVLGEKGECLGAVVNLVDITTLKVIDRLKSEFVAKVSHELRSPLSTIHEQLALVLNDMVGEVAGKGKSDEQHLLSRAKEKTRGLINLIGDLLDLSRIESGAVCNEPKPVVLEELLASIVDFLEVQARAKRQTLELILPDSPLAAVRADPLALESIFGNLITNAINYTPDGGHIQVRCQEAGMNNRIEVEDNGFGIETKYLDRIFERFYRVKNDNTRFITGTGLGLPIVKGLIDSLGGMIDVVSQPGQGTTFTVLLPAGVSAASKLAASGTSEAD